MKAVSVVIPAYNEEQHIVETIKAVKKVQGVKQIIVVDDGSSDNTAQLAEDTGVEVIRIEHNRGKGNALNLGCLQCNQELIALIDADLGASAGELAKLIEPVVNGKADMTIAAFPKAKKKGGIGLVKGLANVVIRIYGGQKLRAPLSGQRVMNRQAFAALFPFAEGFGVEILATIKALNKGLCVMEIETKMHHRETGRSISDFKHRGKQFYHILIALFKIRLLRS
ncbi:glycosyltransferase family 2 protein [Desulfitibacter alkalitolerans]|uniref:glycosyltransferase family 2 protein n=1 Tax=Desulfitibacter alkalitolerans TaxID=264641 RepID=UPI0005544886|nr:glycosyltransferase family 2 protein [Desulfitibacter alkalitolerans]